MTKGSDKLKWYYWVVTYIIIIAGILWTIIPYKSPYFNLTIIAVITAGVLFIKKFPTSLERKSG
jgi:hypothetical protein